MVTIKMQGKKCHSENKIMHSEISQTATLRVNCDAVKCSLDDFSLFSILKYYHFPKPEYGTFQYSVIILFQE